MADIAVTPPGQGAGWPPSDIEVPETATLRNRADNTYFLHVFALTPGRRLASVK